MVQRDLRQLFFAALAVSAVVAALVVERRTHAASRQACWGDIVPVLEKPSRQAIAQMRVIAKASEPKNRGEARFMAIGSGEIRYGVRYYRDQEIGWSGPRYVDLSSCSEIAFPLDEGFTEGYAPWPVFHARDDARDIEVIVAKAGPLFVFRKPIAPGLKPKPLFWHIVGEVFTGIAGVLLAFGLVGWGRGRRRTTVVLAISAGAALTAVLLFGALR